MSLTTEQVVAFRLAAQRAYARREILRLANSAIVNRMPYLQWLLKSDEQMIGYLTIEELGSIMCHQNKEVARLAKQFYLDKLNAT